MTTCPACRTPNLIKTENSDICQACGYRRYKRPRVVKEVEERRRKELKVLRAETDKGTMDV